MGGGSGSCVVCHKGKRRQGGFPCSLVGSQSPPFTLHPSDAEFVASVLVRESKDSPVGDDDKIYYFFTERAGEETTSFFDKSQVARVARVARVCKVGMPPATGSQALLPLVQRLHAGTLGKQMQGQRGTQPPTSLCRNALCTLPERRGWEEDPAAEVDILHEGTPGLLHPLLRGAAQCLQPG